MSHRTDPISGPPAVPSPATTPEAEVRRLARLADNREAQINYMTSEIAAVCGLEVQSPAGTVSSVRDLLGIAESAKAEVTRLRGLLESARAARIELLEDVWAQFALPDGKPGHPYYYKGRWAGGLSTLEAIASELQAASLSGEQKGETG